MRSGPYNFFFLPNLGRELSETVLAPLPLVYAEFQSIQLDRTETRNPISSPHVTTSKVDGEII